MSSILGDGGIKTDGHGLGATLTWYSPDGFYADAQAQFSWYNSDLKSATLGRLVKGNDGDRKAFSVELGKRSTMSGKLTPQIQLSWSDVDFGSFVDKRGVHVSNDYGKNLEGRVGISLDHQNNRQGKGGETQRSHVYGLVNLNYAFLDGTRANVAGTRLMHMKERLWGGMGVGGNYSWASDRSTLYAEASANTALSDFGDSYSLKGSAGFRARF